MATNLCKGIGYVIIGNLYDNVPRPKRLTFWILVCLSLCTALGAIPNVNGDLIFRGTVERYGDELDDDK
jgi:hypothetical protein